MNKCIETIDLSPQPSSLINSLRDIGYSFQSAVADIIDNSIAAKASTIDVQTEWNDGRPYLAIIDNGRGMDKEALILSMRFGCISPLEIRERDDLGRFGLGMKTASISQCRKLTVLSKKKQQVYACSWDIDILCKSESNGWSLMFLDSSSLSQGILAELYESFLADYESGTIVLWENMDRLERSDNSIVDEKSYIRQITLLKEHLDLTYHRFIKPDKGDRKIVFRLNGEKLVGFNPFNSANITTVESPVQSISYQGEIITVQAFILPHHNKVSVQEYRRYGGREGYLHNQGFYVYRNKRLIVKGTWFRLLKKEELTKLIRVRIDIPNTLDHVWKIDIKKSNAQIPDAIRNELKKIIERIQERGKEVYKRKGYSIQNSLISPVWERVVKDSEIFYLLNRDNVFYKELMSNLPEQIRKEVQNYISLVEAFFPKDQLFSDMGSSPEAFGKTTLEKDTVFSILDALISIYPEMSEEKILKHEAFCRYKDLVREYLSNRN